MPGSTAPTGPSAAVFAIGASHRIASAAALGKLTGAAQSLKQRLREETPRAADVPVRELAVLATCNRVEVYATADDRAADEAVRAVRRVVFDAGTEVDGAEPYELRGVDAVRHLCRVAAGLDSAVIGEHEITGQVARAFRDTVRLGPSGRVLEGIGAVARKAARRVREGTNLGRYPASVSSVAVDLARGKLGDLVGLSALVVGVGKAGFLVCKALRASGIGPLVIVNRSPERASEVAQKVGGVASSLAELPELLATADLVVTAAGADGVLVDVAATRSALAKRGARSRPLVVLDLALPRDVDPAVGELEGVELLTLQDIKTQADRQLALRRDEVGPAEAVVDEVVRDFAQARDPSEVEALIGELRRGVEEVRSLEVDRWLEARKSGGPTSRAELDQLTRSIVNKLLHEPMIRLRSAPLRSGLGSAAMSYVGELTGGEGDGSPGPASSTE